MEESIRVWLITGDPGVGKTTVLMKTLNLIKSLGYTVGGIITQEVKEHGARTGFKLVDLATGSEGMLASTTFSLGPRIGKYRINLRVLSDIATRSLDYAIERSEVIVCDEIGPMELFSPEFRRSVERALISGKLLIGIIHKSIRDPLSQSIRSMQFVSIIEITCDNRDEVPQKLANMVLATLVGPQD